MKTSACKAKGRRLQDWTRDLLKEMLGLDEDDIRCALMGEGGEDIKLTKRARELFPYSIECKNQEGIKRLYDFYGQATANTEAGEPLLIIKSNHNKPLVVMDAEFFIRKYNVK
jgi:hypothetical protein